MQKYNQLKINLQAIAANLDALKAKTGARLMPMVKAGAYGTDSIALARHLTSLNVDIVGVSHVLEGIELRKAGFLGHIFTVHAAPFEAECVVDYDLEVALSNIDLGKNIEKCAEKGGKTVKIHLDVNTGMHRFGCKPHDVVKLALEIKKMPHLTFEGVMTHFLAADAAEFDDVSRHQIKAFKQVVDDLKEHQIYPKWIHGANSSAAVRFSMPFCNMVRVGLATFGIYSSDLERSEVTLTPALSLESQIVGINDCEKGESVGYFKGYQVEREKERIAILPVGYHDGLHLHYSGKGYVLIHGKRAPYVGRICMDFMMVNVTDIPEATVGDKAIVFGSEINLEQVAKWGQTNVRELISSLGQRIERQFTRAS